MSYTNKQKVENQCYKLHEGTWYSYTFKKFYCQKSHKCEGGLDLLHSFNKYSELVVHLKEVHHMVVVEMEIPAMHGCTINN